MEIIKRKDRKDAHPYIPELKELYQKGRVTRREFLRNATLLGMSAAAAYAFISPFAPKKAMAAAMPKRGGTWKCGMSLQLIDHPARLSWTEGANVVRQVSEYLSDTGPDNITRPWLCKDVGSSMLGLLSYWGGPQNIEKVDDYHIRLHLVSPNIGVPEHLWHYPGVILPRNFEGDFIKQPVGTGPFILEEFAEGERAVLKARKDYWKMGEDGQPLPYLDKVMYISMSADAGLAAFQSGQTDVHYHPRPSDYLALKDNPMAKILTVDSSYCYPIRMRVDLPPWDDNRVRTALKLCQDRKKTLQLAAYGLGKLAIDAHISPAHPAYCEKPIPAYNPKKAKELLQAYASEKGLKLPLKVKLATKNDEAEPEIAQTLKQTALAGGFDIKLDITEAGGYWDRWTEVDFGITSWTHRSIATMVLPLAYTKESIGAWNETRWYDDEFSALLKDAEAQLDVEKRRSIMCKLEDIMQERGPIALSYWVQIMEIVNKRVHGMEAHPTHMHTTLRSTWLDG